MRGNKIKFNDIIIFALIIIAILVVFNTFSRLSSSDTAKEANNDPIQSGEQNIEKDTDIEPSNKFNVGEIAETENLRISYLDADDYVSDNEFLQPKDGNKYIKCDFEFENIGTTDQYVTIWDSKCYADEYACEQTYLEDDTLSATLSSGKKSKGSVFFEVPENAESIVLEYSTNFWSQNKIIFIVK